MSIFLAVTPQSVCNGAVKIEPLKQLEVDLLNAVNDSGYLSYGSAPKIGHSPLFPFFFFFVLVGLHATIAAKVSFGSKAERNLEIQSLCHLNVITYS